nr:chromate transporter [Modestobacter sp. DSM 44400]
MRGGLVAGTLFVLPGVVALLGLSAIYAGAGDSTLVSALFAGVAPAVLAIVAQAVVRVGGRALGHPALMALAVAAFLALSVFGPLFPAVIAAAAVAGWALRRWAPHTMRTAGGHGSAEDGPAPLIPDGALHTERPSRTHALRVLTVGLLAWGLPVLVVAALTGTGSIFTGQGLFCSGAALVTFGGAYAVLPYVAHQAVQVFGWLAPGGDGPRPGAGRDDSGPADHGGAVRRVRRGLTRSRDLEPVSGGGGRCIADHLGHFVPCFVFIFLGAPYVERLRGNAALSAALSGITAAVVGVIANLAVYFALHTLFARSSAGLGASAPAAARPGQPAPGRGNRRGGRRASAPPAQVVGVAHPRRLRTPGAGNGPTGPALL